MLCCEVLFGLPGANEPATEMPLLHDFFPHAFMHILYSVLHAGPA